MHITLNTIDLFKPGTWILDTGASNHMCAENCLFENFETTKNPLPVHLPDGSIKFVNHTGNIHLNAHLFLENALYIPSFKFNLLSVSKLAKTSNLKFIFLPDHCVLQDLQTEQIMAVGKLIGSLYILDRSSFDSFECKKGDSKACTAVFNDKEFLSLWHKHLGHASSNSLKHIKFLTDLKI